MNNDATHFLFFDDTTADLFGMLSGDGSYVHRLDEWLGFTGADRTERLHTLALALPEPAREQAPVLLETLEALHWAGVRTTDDVALAFSVLEDVSKNRALKSLMNFYLESPLGDDSAYRFRQRIEHLPEGLGEGPLVLVHPGDPLPSFQEAAERWQRLGRATTLQPPWGLCSTTKRRAVGLQGPTGEGIRRLAQTLDRERRRHPHRPQAVLWQGSAALRTELRLQLENRGFNLWEPLPPKEDFPLKATFGSERLRQIRQSSLPLEEKLDLGHQLSSQGAELWDEGRWREWKESPAHERLTDDQRACLTAETPSELGADGPLLAPAPGALWLLPFAAVELPVGCSVAVVGEPSPHPREHPLLTRSDRTRLAQHGFQVRLKGHRDPWQGPLPGAGGRTRLRLVASAPWHSDVKWRPLPPPISAAPRPRPWIYPPPLPLSLSATQLDAYGRCPARYFFSYRLRLRSPELSYPLALGLVVHKALETLLPLAGLPPSDALWSGQLEEAFEAAWNSELPSHSLSHPLAREVRDGFRQQLSRVPELERGLAQWRGPGWRLVGLEVPFEMPWGEFTLKGKIDRLDEGPSGELMVLDYKTGSVDFSPAQIGDGRNTQTLVYWKAVEALKGRPPTAMLYYDLKQGEIRRGLLDRERFPEGAKAVMRGHAVDTEKLVGLLAHGELSLVERTNGLKAGEYTPRPSPDNCRYCDFVVHCGEGDTRG